MSKIDPAATGKGSAILPFPVSRGTGLTRDLHGAPLLSLQLGRDVRSAGVSVWYTSPSGGVYSAPRLLLAERWVNACQTEEECLRVAIQALETRLGELVFIEGEAAK